MIELQNISKTYRVAKRKAGLKEAVKGFFSREYEEIKALNEVSFKVDDGEIVGYIGPNGAGKSSTVKVMSGILTPDSGECVIDGRIPWKDRREHVSHIGVVFGQRSALWWDVPVADSFELLRDIYSVPRSDFDKNLAKLTEMLELGDTVKAPARTLSLGQRMKCDIAAALLHSPRILFLDEPTIGLDATSKLAVRRFISELNRERGTTVILTTHDMNDIEAMAKRVILIGKGRILSDGSVNELTGRMFTEKHITVEFCGRLDTAELPAGTELISLDGEAFTGGIIDGSHRIELRTPAERSAAAVSLLTGSLDVKDITLKAPPIDEVIAKLYRELGI